MSAAKSAQQRLKLYTEQLPASPRSLVDAVGCLPELLQAFQKATGWSLRYAHGPGSKLDDGLARTIPVIPGLELPPGHLRLEPAEEMGTGSEPPRTDAGNLSSREAPVPISAPGGKKASIDRRAAETLAASIADMLGELLQTRHALWRREAELAAGVPTVPHREEEKHLAARLEAVLKGGAEAVGCDAAALYMLDEGTSELKLRSSWGLPFDRLTAPARPLKGAVADLEALLGHAVVLDDQATMPIWNVPEEFPTAVCVPVATSTTLLGTLWTFSNKKCDFNDRQTNIIEVVAGRLAADLEREMLMRASVDGAELKKQASAAERVQRNGLPTIAPMLDGWDVAGWTHQAQGVGGAFHDWFCLPDGLLAVAVGRAKGEGIAAGLSASAVKNSLRAHGQYSRQAERVLQQLNLTLWTSSAGDQHAALFYGLIETATGRVCTASAGQPSAVLLRPTGWESLSHSALHLGESPEADFEQFGYELQPGEAIVLFSDGSCDAPDRQGRLFGEADVAESLQGKLNLNAEELAAAARDVLEAQAPDAPRHDRTILVVKRTVT